MRHCWILAHVESLPISFQNVLLFKHLFAKYTDQTELTTQNCPGPMSSKTIRFILNTNALQWVGKWSWWQCWGHWGLEGQYHHLVRLLHHCHHAVNCHRPDASGRPLFNKTWRGLNGRRMRRIKFDGDNRSLCKNIFCPFVPKHDFDILLAVSKALGFFLLQRHVWPEFTCLTKICWAVQTIHVTWIVSQREKIHGTHACRYNRQFRYEERDNYGVLHGRSERFSLTHNMGPICYILHSKEPSLALRQLSKIDPIRHFAKMTIWPSNNNLQTKVMLTKTFTILATMIKQESSILCTTIQTQT